MVLTDEEDHLEFLKKCGFSNYYGLDGRRALLEDQLGTLRQKMIVSKAPSSCSIVIITQCAKQLSKIFQNGSQVDMER